MAGHSRHGRRPQGSSPPGGRGKSGDARIIYYVMTRREVLYLIDIYAKSAKENLTNAEKREVRKLIAALEAAA